MRIGVIGGRGMLGSAVLEACEKEGWEVESYFRPFLDIEHMSGWEMNDCDYVVNCAAYTQVDKAEKEPTKAFSVNAVGAGYIAKMCRERGMKLIQISTDYVFDGQGEIAYNESDQTNPLNTYGMSKFIGEVLVRKECPNACIVRTQALFGDYGSNFVKAILKQLKDGKKELEVVDDQYTCPTYVRHLAAALVKIIKCSEERKDTSGLLNISASGGCSWYEFAKAIVSIVEEGKDVVVKPVKSVLGEGVAMRPLFSMLCKDRYEELTGDTMPRWETGLSQYLMSINKQGE